MEPTLLVYQPQFWWERSGCFAYFLDLRELFDRDHLWRLWLHGTMHPGHRQAGPDRRIAQQYPHLGNSNLVCASHVIESLPDAHRKPYRRRYKTKSLIISTWRVRMWSFHAIIKLLGLSHLEYVKFACGVFCIPIFAIVMREEEDIFANAMDWRVLFYQVMVF